MEPQTKPVTPLPGHPGAPDLITHLLRDHGLGFFSQPPVRASRQGGLYDLSEMEADHAHHHTHWQTDHEHVWTSQRQ